MLHYLQQNPIHTHCTKSAHTYGIADKMLVITVVANALRFFFRYRYHNNPEQRTLLVTHSNQALNQLFEKIMALDIQERHLLRLGFGEKELDTEKVWVQ
jgi:hypothetical protein